VGKNENQRETSFLWTHSLPFLECENLKPRVEVLPEDGVRFEGGPPLSGRTFSGKEVVMDPFATKLEILGIKVRSVDFQKGLQHTVLLQGKEIRLSQNNREIRNSPILELDLVSSHLLGALTQSLSFLRFRVYHETDLHLLSDQIGNSRERGGPD